jgi:flagellar protein FliS
MSAPAAALAAYAQSSAATASPREVVRMAYERIITACDRAELAERERGEQWLQVFHDEAIRAQAILVELIAGLALHHPIREVAALSEHLERLYRFAMDELLRANTTKSAAPIAGARMVIDGLRDAWVIASR